MNVSSYDAKFCEYLTQAGVEWQSLDEPSRATAENAWRDVYGRAFRGRPRLKQGTKAEFAYQQEACHRYLVIPFSSELEGTPVDVNSNPSMKGYECRGPLTLLGAFHGAEFFIVPPDLAWTMVHTHEDYAFGGPYFIRREWIP